MQQRENFKRMSIEDMKAVKAEKETEKTLNQISVNLEEVCLEEAEKLTQELVDQGYDVDSFELDMSYSLEGDKVIVHIDVVQRARTLEFSLKEASEKS